MAVALQDHHMISTAIAGAAFDNTLAAAFQSGAIFTNNGNLATGIADAANKAFFDDVAGWAANNANLVSSVSVAREQLGGDAAKFSSISTPEQAQQLLNYTKENNLNLIRNTPFDPTLTNDGLPTGAAEFQRYLNSEGIKLATTADTAALNTVVADQAEAVAAPASCSRKIPMICSSVNRLGFMVHLLRGDGLYPFLEEFAGLRPRFTPLRALAAWVMQPGVVLLFSAPGLRRNPASSCG